MLTKEEEQRVTGNEVFDENTEIEQSFLEKYHDLYKAVKGNDIDAAQSVITELKRDYPRFFNKFNKYNIDYPESNILYIKKISESEESLLQMVVASANFAMLTLLIEHGIIAHHSPLHFAYVLGSENTTEETIKYFVVEHCNFAIVENSAINDKKSLQDEISELLINNKKAIALSDLDKRQELVKAIEKIDLNSIKQQIEVMIDNERYKARRDSRQKSLVENHQTLYFSMRTVSQSRNSFRMNRRSSNLDILNDDNELTIESNDHSTADQNNNNNPSTVNAKNTVNGSNADLSATTQNENHNTNPGGNTINKNDGHFPAPPAGQVLEQDKKQQRELLYKAFKEKLDRYIKKRIEKRKLYIFKDIFMSKDIEARKEYINNLLKDPKQNPKQNPNPNPNLEPSLFTYMQDGSNSQALLDSFDKNISRFPKGIFNRANPDYSLQGILEQLRKQVADQIAGFESQAEENGSDVNKVSSAAEPQDKRLNPTSANQCRLV